MRVLVALLALSMLPVAAAGIETPTGAFDQVLYLHLNGRQEIQLSPLAPPAEVAYDERPGGMTASGCIDTPGQRLSSQQQHTWYAVVAPGLVQYDASHRPQPVTERGIRDDLRLVGDPLVLEWYMRPTTGAADEGVAPQVVLQATLREGDDLSVDDQAMNRGRIIAEERTQPADLTPQLSGHPDVTYDEAADVYRFRLPMTPRAPLLVPESESFNLRIDVYTQAPLCSGHDRYAMPDIVSIVSDPRHRPTLTLSIETPVRIEGLSAFVTADAVRFQGHVRAVFGSGDALLEADALMIRGPTPAAITTAWGAGPWQDGRAFPERATNGFLALAAWNHTHDNAEGGRYNVTFTVRTDSGAVTTAAVPFGLGAQQQSCSVLASGEPTCSGAPEPHKRVPAPSIPLALLAAALVRRR